MIWLLIQPSAYQKLTRKICAEISWRAHTEAQPAATRNAVCLDAVDKENQRSLRTEPHVLKGQIFRL